MYTKSVIKNVIGKNTNIFFDKVTVKVKRIACYTAKDGSMALIGVRSKGKIKAIEDHLKKIYKNLTYKV